MIFEKFELPEGEACTVEKVAAELARIFDVRRHEVAILSLQGQILRFLYPAELKTAGAIPLSSHAVAAQTAKTKKAELFNNFMMRRHSRLFELVNLDSEKEAGRLDTQIIQKLMTAPIIDRRGETLEWCRFHARESRLIRRDRISLRKSFSSWNMLRGSSRR